MFEYILILILLVIAYIRYQQRFWIRRGVEQCATKFFLGSFSIYPSENSIHKLIERTTSQFEDKRYFGFYRYTTPILMVQDIDLIKRININDFRSFMDHAGMFPEKCDPYWYKSIFVSQGESWQDVRSILNFAFSSSRLKEFYQVGSNHADYLVKLFIAHPEEAENVNLKDTFMRCCYDIGLKCIMNVESNTIESTSHPLFMHTMRLIDFNKSVWSKMKITLYEMFPNFTKYFKWNFFNQHSAQYLNNIIDDIMKRRIQNDSNEMDIMQLLINAHLNGTRRIKKGEMDGLEITANVINLIMGNADSLSSTLSFLIYDLGLHSAIQQRLYEEIDMEMKESNGKLTMEQLNRMEYLDMVVNESLRKWPSATVTHRVCLEDYKIEAIDGTEKDLYLKKGDIVWFPIWNLHHNPNHFPDPYQFDPERFNSENKKNINPYAFQPFGIGPRNCLGFKFAVLQLKVIVCRLLHKFEIVPTDKTQTNLTLVFDFIQAKAEF